MTWFQELGTEFRLCSRHHTGSEPGRVRQGQTSRVRIENRVWLCDQSDTEKATQNNKCVFRWDLKVETVSEVWMSAGREFQRLGQIGWQLWTSWWFCWQMVKSWMVEEERRVQEGVWMWISSDRYDGARLWRTRPTKLTAFFISSNKRLKIITATVTTFSE